MKFVSENAIRELLREALTNQGAMGYDDSSSPVQPNPSMDRPSLELEFDPIEVKHSPQNKNELIIMVRNILDNVDDEQSAELYRKIKSLVSGKPGQKDFAQASVDKTQQRNFEMKVERKLVNMIRSIVNEELEKKPKEDDDDLDDVDMDEKILPDFDDEAYFKDVKDTVMSSLWDDGATVSSGDEEDLEDEDEDEVAPKERAKRVDLGTGYGVDGDTYEKIGAEMGFTPEAAKKAVLTAMERFKVLHDMEPDTLKTMVLRGVDDYIETLVKTGELDHDDEAFMREHPEDVAKSDMFRDHFSKFVKRAARAVRADTQDDE